MAIFCIATIHGAMLQNKINRSNRPVELVIGEALAHLRQFATVSVPPRIAGD